MREKLDILLRAGSFVTIILLGFLLRKIGFFQREVFSLLSKITIQVTLPCAIITSFSGKVIDPALLSLSVLALCCGLVYVFMGYLVNRNRDREQQSFAILNLPGCNVGNYVIPFAQSFLGASGVIAVSIFDTGNAAICLGGAYSLAAMVKDGNRFSLGRILRSLLRSVPFVTYMLMLLMNLVHLSVPTFVLSVAEIGANANAFMAMLMIRYGLAAFFSGVLFSSALCPGSASGTGDSGLQPHQFCHSRIYPGAEGRCGTFQRPELPDDGHQHCDHCDPAFGNAVKYGSVYISVVFCRVICYDNSIHG